MCKRIDDSMFDSCGEKSKIKYEKLNAELNTKNELRQRLNKIKRNCKYLDWAIADRDRFDSCNKNGNGSSSWADDCKPKLDCEQYCK